MSDPNQRKFEVATMGSDFSEALCRGVLEPKADSLATESFRQSLLGLVQENKKWFYLDDTCISLEFVAQKYTYDSEGNPEIMYNPSITFTRARLPEEFWPDVEIEESDDDEDEDYYDVVVVGDGEEEDEDDDDDDMQGYVQEVWDYYMEDSRYAPRKNLRREYYMGASLIGLISVESPGSEELMLGETPEEDVDLQTHDMSLFCSFSEFDVAVIESICDFDFVKLRKILENMGYFDGTGQADVLSS